MRRWFPLFCLVLLAACSPFTAAPAEDLPSTVVITPAEGAPARAASTADAPTQVVTPLPAYVTAFPRADSAIWSLITLDFQKPVDLQHAGDARLFVVEQRGLIWILQGGERVPDPFLDLQTQVNDRPNERGLLGLAFSPTYAADGRFFVNYTNAEGSTVVAEFRRSDDPQSADPQSQRILLTIPQPFANHNGGGMAFGPEGYLYIGTGDGGSAGDPDDLAQNTESLLGKLLRLDVLQGDPGTYVIPRDNPFVDGGGRAEIWAYGLRNPWRFAFDPLVGDLYIGDVGQNRWEEVDFQPAFAPGGWNYGWDVREGLHPFEGDRTEGLIDPVAEYSHSVGCSVTGGVVVRDAALPAWDGIYLYGDYCTGIVWGLLRDDSGSWVSAALFDTPFTISAFGQGIDGGTYLVHHGGALYRLSPSP